MGIVDYVYFKKGEIIMRGKISFQSMSFGFKGVNDLPLQAVKAYIAVFPDSTINNAMKFFDNGLKGGARNFIIAVKDYSGDNRYITRETVQLKNDKGDSIDCYVSSQFGNSGLQANLPFFVDHIKKCGFTVTGYCDPRAIIGDYNIIDVNKYPFLQELRDMLFNKNSNVIDLVKSMDTCGQLESLDEPDSLLVKTISNTNYIKFSSDTPKDKFGKNNKYDLIKVAAELASKIENSNLSDDIKSKLLELLESFLRNRENNNEGSKQILDRIQDVLKDVNEKEYQDIFDGVGELEKTTNNLIFESPIYGIFSKKENVVIIFLNNILHKCSGNELFSRSELYDSYPIIKKDIERTYVHELFHMIHFSQNLEVADGDYGYKVVIEGLAKYFEIYYSEKFLGIVAQSELDDLNLRHSVISYPYAGACYMNRPVVSFTAGGFGITLKKSFKYDENYNHLALHCLLQGTKELETIIKNLK